MKEMIETLAHALVDQPDLVSVTEISVREAKQVLTGNGNASKIQLEKSVRNLLNITAPIRPYHASDALGLSLIGLYRAKNDQLSYSTTKGSSKF